MKYVQAAIAALSALTLMYCSPVQQAPDPVERPRACAPTGWVDRIEGDWAVVDPDSGEEVALYPVACFPEPPVPGTRVERGRIDHEETERTRKRIQALVKRLMR